MKNLLKLEELAQFLACALALYVLDVPWWVYILLAVGPDIGMIGYLIDTRAGALTYNALHHKGIAILTGAFGVVLGMISVHAPEMRGPDHMLYVSAFILYGHASMDRIFGYGLKFGDSFQHTHLGWIGKLKGQEQ
ncbi:MAG: DUF4260 domain-containing protein [Flavobacteriales bacterium]|nr:DUF4260 domain-containing protein [Flavobacteriales bacterium]